MTIACMNDDQIEEAAHAALANFADEPPDIFNFYSEKWVDRIVVANVITHVHHWGVIKGIQPNNIRTKILDLRGVSRSFSINFTASWS